MWGETLHCNMIFHWLMTVRIKALLDFIGIVLFFVSQCLEPVIQGIRPRFWHITSRYENSIKEEGKASFIVQKSHTVSGHAKNPGADSYWSERGCEGRRAFLVSCLALDPRYLRTVVWWGQETLFNPILRLLACALASENLFLDGPRLLVARETKMDSDYTYVVF